MKWTKKGLGDWLAQALKYYPVPLSIWRALKSEVWRLFLEEGNRETKLLVEEFWISTPFGTLPLRCSIESVEQLLREKPRPSVSLTYYQLNGHPPSIFHAATPVIVRMCVLWDSAWYLYGHRMSHFVVGRFWLENQTCLDTSLFPVQVIEDEEWEQCLLPFDRALCVLLRTVVTYGKV